MTTQTNIDDALDQFVQAYAREYQRKKIPMQVQYDAAWPSPCCHAVDDGEWVNWQVIKRNTVGEFSGLEQALEMVINPQICRFFCRYYSENLNAQTSRGKLQLLFPWNEDDFVRLQQNLVAHVLMKRRLKQADTLFFAITEQDDFMLSVRNSTGEVVLEQTGLEPQEVLASSLSEFIVSLEPVCEPVA